MIQSSVTNNVRLLTLDRPDTLNAFTTSQFERLADLLLEAGQDTVTKVVVLTGRGRAFSAGADLTEIRPPISQLRYTFEDLINILIDFPKPLVLAVNGIGVGVGATLCGLADLVFMAHSARLKCPFSALGITAEACSTYTFPRLMGHQRASSFLFGGQWLSAEQCHHTGLVNTLLPDQGFLEKVIDETQSLAQLPLASLVETKALIMANHKQILKDTNRRENEALARLRGGPANTEAIRAFKEKRNADFSNL